MHCFPFSPQGDAALQELDLSYNCFSEGAGVHLAPMIGALIIMKSAQAYDWSTRSFFSFYLYGGFSRLQRWSVGVEGILLDTDLIV